MVDRILQAFADQWDASNPGTFARGADDVHTLAFATLMLHTSLHNRSLVDAQRMSLSQFEKSVRDCGIVLPSAALADIFERVKAAEFSLQTSTDASAQAPVTPAGHGGSAFGAGAARGAAAALSTIPPGGDASVLPLYPDGAPAPLSADAYVAAKLQQPARTRVPPPRPPSPAPLAADAATAQRAATAAYLNACVAVAAAAQTFARRPEAANPAVPLPPLLRACHAPLAGAVAALAWPHVVATYHVTAALDASDTMRDLAAEAVAVCSEILASCGFSMPPSAAADGAHAAQLILSSLLAAPGGAAGAAPQTSAGGTGTGSYCGGTSLTAAGALLSAPLTSIIIPSAPQGAALAATAAQLLTNLDTHALLMCG